MTRHSKRGEMAKYSRETIDELKDKVDLVDLINSYGVELKKSGTRYSGLCPFHNERSASFSVSTQNYYHCFGCGESGDAFKFIEKMDGSNFSQAVEQLAEKTGFVLPEAEQMTPEEEHKEQIRGNIYKALAEAEEWFHESFMPLPRSHVAKAELNKRELGTQELCEEFKMGYSPQGWDKLTDHLKGKGYTEEVLLEAGLSIKTQSDKTIDLFRGRLMWPIKDIQGRTVGFGGRKLYDEDKAGKYLNSPETPVYKKKRSLYNIERARKSITTTGAVFVVEGYTDVMACYAAGIYNVVASSGTAFGEDHIAYLRRLLDGYGDGHLGKIVYCFDGDSAGQKAARSILDIDSPLQSRSYVLTLPEKLDPCDYKIKYGQESLAEFFDNDDNRVPLIDFVLANEADAHDIRHEVERIAYLNACVPILKKINEPILRNQAMKRVAYLSGVKIRQVEDFLRHTNFDAEMYKEIIGGDKHNAPQDSPFDNIQKKLLATMFQYPDSVDILYEAGLTAEEFTNEDFQIAYFEALGKASDPGSPDTFSNIDLVGELFNMKVTVDDREPTSYALHSWVNVLHSRKKTVERQNAIQRMYGMTEDGFQGEGDKDFYAANEVAEMNIQELNEKEQASNKIFPAQKKKESKSSPDARGLLDKIIQEKGR